MTDLCLWDFCTFATEFSHLIRKDDLQHIENYGNFGLSPAQSFLRKQMPTVARPQLENHRLLCHGQEKQGWHGHRF